MKETEIHIEAAQRTGRKDGQEIDRKDGREVDQTDRQIDRADSQETERLTIEEAFAQLEQLVARLETGETSLEQSFELYQQGMKLVRLCGRKIDRVEKQLIMAGESEENDGL